MKLEKAIEELKDEASSPRYNHDPDRREALELGIEALKKIQEQRNPDGWMGSLELPGETEE